MFPLARRLVSCPCFSTAPSRFLSRFRGNHQSNFPGSEPSLRLVCHWAQNKPNEPAKIPGVLRAYLKTPGLPGKYQVILPVSSSLPQILPQTQTSSQHSGRTPGKLESCWNGAPNTLWFPWKFPETQSAGHLWLPSGLPENDRETLHTGQKKPVSVFFLYCGAGDEAGEDGAEGERTSRREWDDREVA